MKLSSAKSFLFIALAFGFAKAQPPPEECGRECEPAANGQDGTNERCILMNPACKFCKETGNNIGVCVPDEPTCGQECDPISGKEHEVNEKCRLIDPSCPYCPEGKCVPGDKPPTPPPIDEPRCGRECDPVSGREHEINKSCYLIDASCPYCPEGICVPEITKEPTSPPTRSPIDPPTDPPTRSPVDPPTDPPIDEPQCGRKCDYIGLDHEVNFECVQMDPHCPYCVSDGAGTDYGKCVSKPPECGHPCQLNGQATAPSPDCMNVSPHCPFCVPDGSSAIGKCAETLPEQRRLRRASP